MRPPAPPLQHNDLTRALPRSATWTYGLAFLGAHLGFMPLLVLLLPRRIEAFAPDDAAVLLSWLLLIGGVVAGLAHILAGGIGDRWIARFGNRRGLIAIGTGLIVLSYIGLARAESFPALLAAIIFFQISLNCCFAPLGALLADHFPHEMKGRLGGLANAAMPASVLVVAVIAVIFPVDTPWAFVAVGALSAACVVPLLVLWPFSAIIAEPDAPQDAAVEPVRRFPADFAIAWTARLLIQIGAVFVTSYIYLFIAATQASSPAWETINASEILAILTVPAALLAILATLIGGHVSDWRALRRVPAFLSAMICAVGLGGLAMVPEPWLFIAAYCLFQIGLAAFLSIDTALVAQLVSGHPRRGTMLGVMNLANTMPAIIAPTLILLAFREDAIAGALSTLFGVLTICTLTAGAMMLFIRNVR